MPEFSGIFVLSYEKEFGLGEELTLMTVPIDRDPGEATREATEQTTEIDALVETMDRKFVSDNLRELLEAGASTDVIRGKLSTEGLLDRAAELMSYGVTQEQIMAGLNGLTALHYKDKVIAAGIVLDPDDVLKAIQEWQLEREGHAPHDAVTKSLDFVLALGVSADDMLEVIKKDERSASVYLLQSAKKLKQAGADISADDVNTAIMNVWNSCRNERVIFENILDLIEIGAECDFKYLVDETLRGQEGVVPIFYNAPQIIAAGVELDLNNLLAKLRGGHTAVHQLDFLLTRPEVNLTTVLAHLTSDAVEENFYKLATAFRTRGESIDPLVSRLQGSQVTRRIDYLLDAGASRELILKRSNSHWILEDIQLLMDREFTATEIAAQLSARNKIEKFATLKNYGAEVNLDEAVASIIDEIDEFYLRDFPDAYEKAAAFFLEHLKTLHGGGADILMIRDHEKLKEIIEKSMTREHASLFALTQIRATKK
jgi:hypothetical protein